MKILTVDIGTGTQDIFLYDSRLDLENGFKLILPSPTMMIHHRIKTATEARLPILLTGFQMGGGPSVWAAEAHARAGLPVYATPDAAKTFDDEPDKIETQGIRIISDQEALRLSSSVLHLELKDFDLPSIVNTFAGFGASLSDLDAIAVAVFDHGAAPSGVSDRQFRFDYLDRRIRGKNSLSAFAYLSTEIPEIMTRLQAVADSAGSLNCPLIVMDTAPAAILGATFDPVVAKRKKNLITNIGNFHTLAFRLAPAGIEGLFEHHTGELDLPKLVLLLRSLANNSLKNEDVFNDMGHGALIYHHQTYPLGRGDFDVVVTGPRRSLFNQRAPIQNLKPLRPYFAAPFGDMMLTGCFGLLAATAEIVPNLGEQIKASLGHYNEVHSSTAPWEVE